MKKLILLTATILCTGWCFAQTPNKKATPKHKFITHKTIIGNYSDSIRLLQKTAHDMPVETYRKKMKKLLERRSLALKTDIIRRDSIRRKKRMINNN